MFSGEHTLRLNGRASAKFAATPILPRTKRNVTNANTIILPDDTRDIEAIRAWLLQSPGIASSTLDQGTFVGHLFLAPLRAIGLADYCRHYKNIHVLVPRP